MATFNLFCGAIIFFIFAEREKNISLPVNKKSFNEL
jgi:hypothetical protein